jgi:hypothetical protein
MSNKQMHKTWLGILSREIASSNLRKDVFFIWVSTVYACRRRTDRRVAINVCLQLILTNEKYRRLISILLPLTGVASASRRSARAFHVLEDQLACTVAASTKLENACQAIETSALVGRNTGRDKWEPRSTRSTLQVNDRACVAYADCKPQPVPT